MISSNLAPLVVAAMMLPTFPRHFHPLMKCLGSGLDDHSFDEFSGACSSIFPTAWFMDSKEPRKYHNLLSEFLGDPIRSKEFYVDGNKFATLATALARILFGPTYVLPLLTYYLFLTLLTDLNLDQTQGYDTT
jgi:hypothetical protein